MRIGHRRSTLVLVAALAAAARPSWADEAGDARRARSQFQRALELAKAGDCAQAIPLFREVGQFRMTSQVRYQIASCEERVGHLVAALGGYELALSEGGGTAGADFVAEVEARARDLRARIPRLVIVRGEGAEAAVVTLNGTALGEASLAAPIPVDPGPHTVEASAPGRRKFSKTLRVAERETAEVQIVIGDANAPESAPPAPADAGPRAAGGPLPADRPSVPLGAWIAGGAGLVALGGAGLTWMLRQDRKAELDTRCGPDRRSCPPSARSTYDDAKLYDTLSPVLLGVGVAGVGAAAALWLLRGDSERGASERSVAAEPVLAGQWSGVVVRGRF